MSALSEGGYGVPADRVGQAGSIPASIPPSLSALSTGRQRPETAAGLAFPAGRGGASLPVLSALTERRGSRRVAPEAERVRCPTDLLSVSAFTERSTNGLALVEDVGRARRCGTTGGSLPILLRGDPMAASEKRTACELVERPTLRERKEEPAAGYWQTPKAGASRVTTRDAWKPPRLSDSVRAKNEAPPRAYSYLPLSERPRSPCPAGGRHVTRPNRPSRRTPPSPLQTRPSVPPERGRPVLTAATQPTGRPLYH